MEEMVPPQRYSEPDPAMLRAQYMELSAEDGVRARFKLYEFVKGKPFDVNDVALGAIQKVGKLPVAGTVLDIGTADGTFLDDLRWGYGHRGPARGIDAHPKQFENREPYGGKVLTAEEWKRIGTALTGASVELDVESIRAAQESGAAKPFIPPDDVEITVGFAQELQAVPDASVDVLSALFMLYHLTDVQRQRAFQEFARVLKPGGVFLVATSDPDNKRRHRDFEREIANHLHITAPAPMNMGFTTDKMIAEVPRYFKHLFVYDYQADMRINTTNKAQAYFKSLWSLRNQFVPPPPARVFAEALEAVVNPVVRREINLQGAFKDTIHRSLGIAANEELVGLAGLGFRQVA